MLGTCDIVARSHGFSTKTLAMKFHWSKPTYQFMPTQMLFSCLVLASSLDYYLRMLKFARIDLQTLMAHIDGVVGISLVFDGSDSTTGAALGAVEADCCFLGAGDGALIHRWDFLLDLQAFSVAAHVAGDDGSDDLGDRGHVVNFLKLDFLNFKI